MNPWRLKRACVLILLASCLVCSTGMPVSAQGEPVRPDVPAAWPITEEQILAQKKQIETAALPSETAQKIQALYDEALKVLRDAKGHAAAAAEFQQNLEQAPERLRQIRQQLEQSAPPAEPQVPPDASVQQLDHLLGQARTSYQDAQNKASLIEEESRQRTERRKKISEDISRLRKSLEDLQERLAAPAPAEEPAEQTQARQTLLSCQKLAAEKEIERYQKEIASYDARGELIIARRDLAARQLGQADELVKSWQKIVDAKRREQTKTDVKDAKEIREQVAWSHDVVKQLAEENTQIAERRLREKLPDKIEATNREYDRIEKLSLQISSDYKNLTSKLQAVGLTHEMSLRLRKMRDSLPDVRELRKDIRRQLDDLGNIQIRQIELQEQRSIYDSIEPLVRDTLARVESSVGPEQRTSIEKDLRKLYNARRNYYTALYDDFNSYYDKLESLIEKERDLAAIAEEISLYIDERVLWIRSTTVFGSADLKPMLKALRWLFTPGHYRQLLISLGRATVASPAKGILGLLFIIAWILLIRRRLIRPLIEHGKTAARSYTYSFAPTLAALGITAGLILPAPVILGWLYWLLASYPDSSEPVRALAEGIRFAALLTLLLETIRHLCRPQGLAEDHFAWPIERLRRLRRHIRWLYLLLLPLGCIVAALEWLHQPQWENSLGRLAFIGSQILLYVFIRRILRAPKPGGAEELGSDAQRFGWVKTLQRALPPLVPILLGFLAFIGFYYTAMQLTRTLWAMLWLCLILWIANDLALRWILVSQRHLAIEKARKKRLALQEKLRQQNANAAPSEVELPPQPELDLSSISAQTKNLLHSVIIFALLVGLWLVWAPVIPALNILDNIPVSGLTNLGDVLLSILILCITFFIGRNLPGLLEIAILQKLPLQAGVSFAITSITKYIITIIGVVVAFNAIGIGWAKVQWLAAAITVGLGFGLQEIFANFVSGLIILFERPIRVGDIVTVGAVDGKVTRIQMRATTITDWDRRELLVPNREFITNQLINWTLSDPITRVVIPVGIAYGSDTQKARDLLLQIARESPLIMNDPKPQAIFRRFGESALDFELRVFIADRDRWPKLIHEMHTKIDQAFRAANIEIAFPQRDVHIRSIRDILPIRQEQAAAPLGEAARPTAVDAADPTTTAETSDPTNSAGAPPDATTE
ncbi:MAG: mechanosensitive ion channel [Sedimentisphaerales bacterium]|nr:mechanosensitive ion channel [Sedimentisphaerales bacterium]